MAKDERHHFLVVFLTGSLGILLGLSLIPTGAKPNLLGNIGSGASFSFMTASAFVPGFFR